jgi:putative ABC transport system permease protein
MKTPLAWLQLSHEKIRLLVALAGISFADILMFMQLGFRDALFDASTKLHRYLEGDIFMLHTQTVTVALNPENFSSRRLYQAATVEGVEKVVPVYANIAVFKNPVKKNNRNIYVIGINPEEDVLNIPGVKANRHKLKMENTMLFDYTSRAEFGPIAEYYNRGEKVTAEVNGRKMTTMGLFALGVSFGADGNIIVSDLDFLRLFQGDQEGLIDVGVIQLKPGADREAILKVMRENLPTDVKVYNREEFINHEKYYWQTSTAIGFIFTLGSAMGFIVGIVIVYQILYTDVADHLPEYATMKAMGYTDRYLLIVVFQEAIILAIVGYIPGLIISRFLYKLTAVTTMLPIMMTMSRAIFVFILTLVMCMLSGAIAVRKLSAADPADIF